MNALSKQRRDVPQAEFMPVRLPSRSAWVCRHVTINKIIQRMKNYSILSCSRRVAAAPTFAQVHSRFSMPGLGSGDVKSLSPLQLSGAAWISIISRQNQCGADIGWTRL